MGPESEPERARLLEVIAESDQAIHTGRETPDDPVAVRVVTDALISKGEALSQLERFDESVPVWNELLARSVATRTRFQIAYRKVWDLAQNPRDPRIPDAVDDVVELFQKLERPQQNILAVADALMRKSYVLEQLGYREQAARVDAELLREFSADPEASGTISTTLGTTIWRMLQTPESVDAALIASEQLRVRLASEPDETLAPLARVVETSAQVLTGITEPSLTGIASLVAVTLVNSGVEGWRTGESFLERRAPAVASLLPGPGALEAQAAKIALVRRTRQRFGQALKMCDSLIERIGDNPDAELRRSAAMAKIYRGVTLTGLGHIREGFRTFGHDEASEEPGAAAAYQQIADAAELPEWLKGFGLGSALNLRAAALGGNDKAITQLAYDEAVQALPTDIRSGRLTALAFRLLRPRSKTTVVMPDHPPEPPTT